MISGSSALICCGFLIKDTESKKNHCKECGQLTPWSLWSLSVCSRTCGGGVRTRERTCRHAKGKDNKCEDSKPGGGFEIESEERPCATDPCRKLIFEIVPI